MMAAGSPQRVDELRRIYRHGVDDPGRAGSIVRIAVLLELSRHPDGMSCRELAAQLGLDHGHVKRALTALRDAGRARCAGRGMGLWFRPVDLDDILMRRGGQIGAPQ